MKKVALIMGSRSDLEAVKPAFDILTELGVQCDVSVMSAHRTPRQAAEFAATAAQNGYGVLICAAGKAAHLAGVMAGGTILPVIGIPIKSSTMDGLDSLLSTVQMPGGVPVATVAVNGALNAGLLAAQMLALSDEGLTQKLVEYKAGLEAATLAADAQVQQLFNKVK